jgi:Gluconate 2-dehydrogenase subunit 3
MHISRRTAFKQVFVVAGGVIFLPACFHHKDKSALTLHHLSLDGDQLDTLEALADTLLPAGSTPLDTTLGAKAVGAHLFALKMIDDCYPASQQQRFMSGLAAFDERVRSSSGKSFTETNQILQSLLVATFDAAAYEKNISQDSSQSDLFFFFRENKKLLIRGYLGSQYFLTKIEVYELVPGRWHGCMPVIKNS